MEQEWAAYSFKYPLVNQDLNELKKILKKISKKIAFLEIVK